MIAVIPYEKRYFQQVFDLIVPIQREEFGIDISAEKQPDLADIPGYYQSGLGNFWLAREGDSVVGSISLKDIGDGDVALRKMFVKSSHRGREKGIAAALLRTALEWSARQNVKTIYLGTTAQFLAAHRFYEKNGFAEIPKSALPASFPVMDVDTKFYRCNVTT